ncbi:6-bladed beta-propeller [Rhodocytophaga rosea]|uniref:6-bladed beta-propeller n=1 Tax=Rhodocytophaga rosea TaxID=2704465 RepID=A0A6C0GPB7_9BACT|nr:6-bladed beta-propeller [Rhodocytophaga rosea]QHT69422.1 6-bladed beta-propeller [Rhodocytophaga rosea]
MNIKILLFCLFQFFFLFNTSQAQYVYEWQIGAQGIAQFTGPGGLALDQQGNMYVTDQHINCVYKVSGSGQLLLKFGFFGTGDGQFYEPTGVALDKQGNIYVTDYYNNRVQKFNPEGEFLLKFGVHGIGNGEFYYPEDIEVDVQGNVYVTDFWNNRIQKFNPDGQWLTSVGSYGSGDYQFISPRALAFDQQGNLYVADRNCIRKFNSDGQFIMRFGSQGTGIGQFQSSKDIEIDAEGNTYITDSYNKILKFSSTGDFLASFGTKGKEEGQLDRPTGIALDAKGNIYVADRWNHRVQQFNSAGAFVSVVGEPKKGSGQFFTPLDVALDEHNNIYVADRGNHRIQKFDAAGNFVFAFGSEGIDNGEFTYPNSVVVDKQGNIYVSEENDRIQKFNAQGEFLAKWGSDGSADGQFKNPHGLVLDKEGNIYVADQYNHRIQKFSSNGDFLSKFGSSGSANGQFAYPAHIAIDSQGSIYVADQENHRIQKFSNDGVFLSKFGTKGSIDGQMTYPIGITIDSEDHIYVADAGNHHIQQFNSNGDFISKTGTHGFSNGQLFAPMGLTIDAQGSIYVADAYNHRVQKFSLAPQISLRNGITPVENNTSFNIGETHYLHAIDTAFTIDNTAGKGILKVANLILPQGFTLDSTFPESIEAGTTASFTLKLLADKVGSYTGNLSFSTNDPDNKLYQVTLSGLITKAEQQISINALADRTYGDAPFTLTGNSSSGLALTFSMVSGPATLEGNVLTLTGAGEVTLLITQAGDNYYKAAELHKTFLVKKANQIIHLDSIPVKTYGDSSFTLPLTTSAGLPITYTSSNAAVATISANHIAIAGVGTTIITANQAGNDNYNPAETANQTLQVNKSFQKIHFDHLADQILADSTFQIIANASSTLPVNLMIVSGPASLVDNTLKMTGIGEVIIKASQLGNVNYWPAEEVIQRFCILPIKPVITATNNNLSSSSLVGNQWYLDGEAIEGATEWMLSVSKEGRYQVSVAGPCGQAIMSEPFLVKLSALDEYLTDLVKVYPNPVLEHLKVEIQDDMRILYAQIVNSSGKVLTYIKTNGVNNINFSIGNLKQGMYILEMYTSKGTVRKKIIKQ